MSDKSRSETRSTAGFITAMLIFGTIGIFRRYLPVSSPLLAFWRGISGALFLALTALFRGKKLLKGMDSHSMLCYAGLGALIGLNWMMLFEAYNYTSVATATLCYYMQPAVIILASPAVFGEKLTSRKLICAAVSFLGMALVSGIPESGLPGPAEARGILCGLGAALLYAFVVILNKKLPPADAYDKTVIQLFSAALILVPYLLAGEDMSGVSSEPLFICMMLIVGFVHTGLAYVLYFGSMEGMSAQSIALLGYLDPVTALILSALILKEAMSPSAVLGAVMILSAALISEK